MILTFASSSIQLGSQLFFILYVNRRGSCNVDQYTGIRITIYK